MQIKSLLSPIIAGFVLVSTLHAGTFAGAVVNYDPGTGFTAGYTNTSVILGHPAFTNSPTSQITPFSPPFRTSQILSVGAGGSLTVSFNPPIVNAPGNIFGRDFIIFGNSFFTKSNNGTATGAVFADSCQATVSVSEDGVTFYKLNPSMAPQLNYFFPTDGAGNYQIPVNPSLTNFTGLTLAQIRELYNGSAGGAAYAVSWAQDANNNSVSLLEVRQVRIDVQSGQALVAGFASVTNANQIFAEDFVGSPALDGWNIFGDTNLFTWDPIHQNLDVTWDSSQSNSYFYHPLGTVMGTNDDFTMSFDLLLTDYAIGVDPEFPDTFQISSGFLNYGEATSTNFSRGGYPSQPDLAEFDFFQWDNDFSTNTVNATFVDSQNGFAFGSATNELPSNAVMQVSLNYTASNQTGTLTVTTNGVLVLPPAVTVLNSTNNYAVFGDYHLDTFAVESYSQVGGFGGSLLAHGTIGNILIVAPPPPVSLVLGGFSNGTWNVQFVSRTNWNYILEGSADLQTWLPSGPPVAGTGTNISLQDTNSVQQHQFYRVNAQRAD